MPGFSYADARVHRLSSRLPVYFPTADCRKLQAIMAGLTFVGEFVQDGIHFCEFTTREVLSVMSQVAWRPGDVVLACHQKTGRVGLCNIVCDLCIVTP